MMRESRMTERVLAAPRALVGRAVRTDRRALVSTAVFVALLVGSGTAHAGFITEFDGSVTNRDAGGNPVAATQAGSHPEEVSTTISVSSYRDEDLSAGLGYDVMMPFESVRDTFVDLPAGFIGNPTAAARCTDPQLADDSVPGTACPADSQVGMAIVETATQRFEVPIFNMVPPPGAPGAFAFRIAVVPVHLRARVRSGTDYGLSIDVSGISQALPITSTRLTFWGVPASPRHDAERKGGPSDAPQRAFFTNPTECKGPLETRLRATTWNGSVDTASFLTHQTPPNERELVGAENCDRLPFDIRLTAAPRSTRVNEPSGYAFDIDVPQSDVPSALAQSHLKKAVVTLPKGVSISPSAAAGLDACSDAQTTLGNDADPSCPEASKIGTMTIDTPLLSEQMSGSIYLRQPQPGNLFRLLLVARGPGVVIKLPGDVRPDPVTGQLTATFDNNPQLPFSNLHLEFKGGPRAALTNPPACGTYTTNAEMTGWSGKVTTSTSSFNITRDGNGAPCPPRGFAPSFVAGLTNPAAGKSSTFSLTFARGDEDQTLRDITVSMPEGLTGVIANATLCADAQAAAGTCGEGSRIGSTTTGAGTGSNPFFLGGRVYITGPYKGAPFGMSIVVPAIAGPFNLGTVVVRASIDVDRRTAQLRVASDPLPTILEGVPLLIRKVNIAIDKPGFMLAPTNCAPKSITARIGSNEGASAAGSSRFQVGSCKALPYKPKLAIKIGDRKHRRAESTAPLTATLTMPRGAQSNNKSIEVTLPANVNSRLAALRGACSVEAARARTCGRDAIVGTAVAVTPLLRDPLTGPVYIVRTAGNRLPDLWVALRGQIEFDLIGRVKIVGSRLQLRTTFGEIPDVPVSMFRLNFISGRNAAIGLVRGICSKTVQKGMVAGLLMRGENGRIVTTDQRMQIGGCGRVTSSRRASGRRTARRASKG